MLGIGLAIHLTSDNPVQNSNVWDWDDFPNIGGLPSNPQYPIEPMERLPAISSGLEGHFRATWEYRYEENQRISSGTPWWIWNFHFQNEGTWQNEFFDSIYYFDGIANFTLYNDFGGFYKRGTINTARDTIHLIDDFGFQPGSSIIIVLELVL